MSDESSKKANLKQKAKHELEQLTIIFLYLAFFFCAIATYSMLLLDKFYVWYFAYGFALINAFAIAKVILIGEYVRLGKKLESKPLLLSAIYKSFLFGLLAFVFHIIEEVIKHLLHGQNMATAFRDMRIDELLARSVVIFCTFIPLFAFRELQRVMGEDDFQSLFFKASAATKSDLSGSD
jgi:hypothetical protein